MKYETYCGIRIEGNNYFVNDRKMGYKGDELLKIDKGDNIPNNEEEEKLTNQKREEVILKRVGIDKNNIVEYKRPTKRKVK